MGLRIRSHGSWDRTIKSVNKIAKMKDMQAIMEHYGQIGGGILSSATPKDTGLTASSWSYVVDSSKHGRTILGFKNSNINKGVSIAVILQYGHGTRNGGYVQGIDYINPASQLIFKQMVDDLWSEVKGL